MTSGLPVKVPAFLAVLLFAALVGISVFAYFAWRAVGVESVTFDAAIAELEEVESRFTGHPPMIRRVENGYEPNPHRHEGTPAPASHLRVLIFQEGDGRMVRASAPFWFLQMKGPAVRMIFRGTDVDLRDLGAEPKDIEAHGAGIVLREVRQNGDRILIWAE